jgi:osmoprotectant transport system substrate-binding protein/osmoprotectant transport system permease protein
MTGGDLTSFVVDRLPELWMRTGEHILLVSVSTGLAILLAIPIAIFASRRQRIQGLVLGAIGILQTIPSLAMLAILLAVLEKIGVLPAIIALILYALLPIARNTLTGLEGVSKDVIEAATGIGMTLRQQLWMVRMPLAMPFIIAGVRTAAVVGVGIATLAAFIGAGGLGQFINRGLALSDTRLILLGAIPAAILALIVDGSIALVQWGLTPTQYAEKRSVRVNLKRLALAQPFVLAGLGILAGFWQPGFIADPHRDLKAQADTIKIGSKRFSEQFIIGEMIAQLIESRTDLKVERLFNLGGTMINHGALENGQIDIYPEYTGTALTAILKKKAVNDPEKALRLVRDEYRSRFDVEWLQPFGFNNAYSITVREADAEKHGWKKISDLKSIAPELRAGWTAEFAERPDGYPGLRKAYGFDFGEVLDIDPALMYKAVANGEVDVICAYTTDGRIPAYKLRPLIDDRNFFPPYHAAPVIRAEVLIQHPQLRNLLNNLAGILDDATMQKLNYQVDEEQRPARDVAREFLRSKGLVK